MISKINTYVTALVLISSIFASDQRIASLGGNAGFWAEDDQNLYMFPATMHNFNLAQIQGVNGDNSKATFLFGEGTKYGFMMNQTSDNLVNFVKKKINIKQKIKLVFLLKTISFVKNVIIEKYNKNIGTCTIL